MTTGNGDGLRNQTRSTSHDATRQLYGSNLTASQYRIWLGQQLAPDVPLYNMVMAFWLHGPLEVDRFRQAFRDVVAGCDALRNVVEVHDGVPRQRTLEQIGEPCSYSDFSDRIDPERELERWIDSKRLRLFDLDKPMFDSVLVKLHEDKFVWYLNQHHLITDAWSTAVMYRRLSDRYLASARDSQDSVPAPQYHNYVEHESTWRQSPQLKKARRYWEERCATPAPTFAFYGRGVGERSSRTERVTLELGAARSARLHDCADNAELRSLTRDLTGLNIFLTMFFAWQHRISGQQSLAIGTMTHNRSSADFRNTVGLFIELFPVAVDCHADDSFFTLLQRVKSATMSVLPNAQPGASVFTGKQPFQTVLNYNTVSFGDFAGLPMTSTWVHADHGDPDHLLRLQVHDFDASGCHTLHFDFNTDVFDDSQRRRTVGQFLNVLDAFLDDPQRSIASVALCGAQERSFVLELAEPDTRLTVDESVVAMFGRQARQTPSAIAVDTAGSTLTYQQLDLESDQLAQTLRQHSVGHGGAVAICMPRSNELVVAVLGILKAGAAYVPMELGLPPQRARHILADSQCSLALTCGPDEDRLSDLIDVLTVRIGGCSGTDDGSPADPVAPPLQQAAYIIYTSGSTGKPKGVVVEHSALSHYVQWARQRYVPTEPRDFALFSSFSFDLTVTSIFVPLVSGGRIVVYGEQERGPADLSVLDVFADSRVDVVKLTPSHLSLLQQMDLRDSRIRCLIVGGEDFRADLARSIHDAAEGRVEIFNEYGPTEATVACMIHRYDPQADVAGSVPIGRPADHASIFVLDQYAEPVPMGVAGEICIGGAGLAREYLNQPQLTAERFLNHSPGGSGRLYRTGDLGRWRADGVLEYLGRRDRQVKVSGARIELAEVESALAAHPQVSACVVDAVQHRQPKREDETPRRCSKCGIPSNHPHVDIGRDGVCNLCTSYVSWQTAASKYFGKSSELQRLLGRACAEKNGRKYDSLMLMSGGKDSTFALYKIVEMGARPLVFSLDNGYISDQAKANIRRVVDDLGLDLEFGETPAMNSIFVDSLKRFGNVCNGCYKTIYTLAINLARKHGIRVIVTGLSRGQIFETRLEEFYRNGVFDVGDVDHGIVEARRAYHLANDAVSRLLDVELLQDETLFDEIQIVDFYRYCDVELAEVQEFLRDRVPWIRPDDTGRSTNCLINAAGIHVHQRDRGFHNYAAPYAWDVRLGHKTRAEALEELDDQIDESEVQRMLTEIGYDEDWRQNEGTSRRLVAWYVADEDLEAFLRTHLAQTLPTWMCPSRLVRLDELPLTPNGKVDRDALQIPKQTEVESNNYVAPRTATERTLVEIWQDVLGYEQIGVEDDFFELGGDSILNIQIVARAGQAGLKLTPRLLFEHPTIAALAELAGTAAPAVVAEPATGVIPLTPIQHWFFEQFGDRPDRFCHAVTLEVKERIDLSHLRRAIAHLLRHHDVLRSQFTRTDGGWNAEILASVDYDVLSEIESKVIDDTVIARATSQLADQIRIGTGDLVRAAIVRSRATQPDRLIMVIHHLVVDAVSWQILLEDLEMVLRQLSEGREIDLPPRTASWQTWAQELLRYYSSDEVTLRLSRSLVVNGESSTPTSAADLPPNSSFHLCEDRLWGDDTRRLLEASGKRQLSTAEVLLAALARSISETMSADTVSIDVEQHGREEFFPIDLSRTVGWFTAIQRLELSDTRARSDLDLLDDIRNTLRSGISRFDPWNTRYLSPDLQLRERIESVTPANVVFNYLGSPSRRATRAGLLAVTQPLALLRDPEQKRPWLMECNAWLADSELQVHWSWTDQAYREHTIRDLTKQFRHNLRALVDSVLSQGGVRPTTADFPLAGLSAASLSKLAGRLDSKADDEGA